jgi:hypothetical protein
LRPACPWKLGITEVISTIYNIECGLYCFVAKIAKKLFFN